MKVVLARTLSTLLICFLWNDERKVRIGFVNFPLDKRHAVLKLSQTRIVYSCVDNGTNPSFCVLGNYWKSVASVCFFWENYRIEPSNVNWTVCEILFLLEHDDCIGKKNQWKLWHVNLQNSLKCDIMKWKSRCYDNIARGLQW